MNILLVDNYDSFTYNLVHLIKQVNIGNVDVVYNDKIDFSGIDKYDKIIFSPGPDLPNKAGDMMKVIDLCKTSKSMLGICLGHQAIGECFGARLINHGSVFHGVQSDITKVSPHYILDGINHKMQVGRYHSWSIDSESIGKDLIVTSVSEDGIIMSIRHRQYDINGVQFHPESILTNCGVEIMKAFLLGKSCI